VSSAEAVTVMEEPAALFAQHHEPLHRYLARLTGDPDLAADAAQEAFVRLLEQQPPPDEPRPWLFRVATNVVRDTARAGNRHRVLEMDGRAQGVHGDRPRPPDRVVDRQTAQRMMRTALEALNEKEKQALLMREEGFKHREIAEALGTTTGSIGTLLRRALGKAAERLRQEEEES
jgi:RNA polymerase sigma factor (sigma-70 family)